MSSVFSFSRIAALAVLLVALACPAAAKPVKGGRAAPPPGGTITVDIDEGQLLRLPRPAAHVFVANPAIADLQVPQPQTVLLLGKKAGRTTVIALDPAGGEIVRYAIAVTPGLGAIQEHLARDYPDLAIQVEGTPTSLIVQGRVDTPEQARGVVELVKAYAPDPAKVVSRLNLTAEVQVQLRVYIAEVARSAVEQFGVDWQAVFRNGSTAYGVMTGGASLSGIPVSTSVNTAFAEAVKGKWSIAAAFEMLGKRGLSTVLAEPALTAISGQTASFLAGGEIPVVTQNSQDGTTVTYKEYGVRLNFTPTVMSNDRINLAVRPEVSQLTDNGAVEISDIVIPALRTRRVDTSVELGSGDSFVIGGLLQRARDNSSGYRVPILSDIPILGALFQSQTFQNDESELVVMVTPYIVRPTKPDAAAAGPSGNRPATETERLMTGATGTNGGPRSADRLNGRAGLSF
jgi:pilus assembly protein CpaC